jgi:hypothetical protein
LQHEDRAAAESPILQATPLRFGAQFDGRRAASVAALLHLCAMALSPAVAALTYRADPSRPVDLLFGLTVNQNCGRALV